MKQIDKIRNMSVEEMAEKLIQMPGGTYDYCKGDCDGASDYGDDWKCEHEKECCINWLNEEVGKP